MPKYPKTISKIIDYPSAPSKRIRIGKYIPPFEENDTGFGFKGVVIEDVKEGSLQCYICGEWFKNLSTHINLTHKISCPEYKREFGLLQSTALKSKKMRLKQSELMIGMRKKHKKHRIKFKKGNSYAGNRKGKKKAGESQNKYGVCDLQIMQKVIELKEELKRTPTLIDLKKRYGGTFLFHLHKRYGSYIKYCNEIGFEPNFSNYNPKYSKQYFIEKALSNEPSLRIFTTNEEKALYKFFKGEIKELKREEKKVKNKNK